MQHIAMLAACAVICADQLKVKQKYAWKRAALIQMLLPAHHHQAIGKKNISGQRSQLHKSMSCQFMHVGIL